MTKAMQLKERERNKVDIKVRKFTASWVVERQCERGGGGGEGRPSAQLPTTTEEHAPFAGAVGANILVEARMMERGE